MNRKKWNICMNKNQININVCKEIEKSFIPLFTIQIARCDWQNGLNGPFSDVYRNKPFEHACQPHHIEMRWASVISPNPFEIQFYFDMCLQFVLFQLSFQTSPKLLSLSCESCCLFLKLQRLILLHSRCR